MERCCMNSTVREWVAKAEADFAMAAREMRAGRRRNNDGIYFHAQQAIEKLMKAAMIHDDQTPPRTHDLVVLSKLLLAAHTLWRADAKALRFLTQGAVMLRYPGESATAGDARKAMTYARALRKALLDLLQP